MCDGLEGRVFSGVATAGLVGGHPSGLMTPIKQSDQCNHISIVVWKEWLLGALGKNLPSSIMVSEM